MGWLTNNTALITGGGSGLGRALVERYLDEGACVGVLERDEGKAEGLTRDFGNRIEVTVGSVTQYADNAKAVAATVRRFGKLDTFVGNAGVFDCFHGLVQLQADSIASAFDELFSVNVKGGLLGAKAALPELLKTRGNIIFTLSNAAFYPGGGGPLYTASKHALLGLVRQLAHELAPKVRVNGVAPGGMQTELRGLSATGTSQQKLNQIENFDDLIVGITPLRIAPKPKDYCGPYVLLASRENAAPITGSVINTDGGLGVRGIIKVAGGEDL